MYTRNRLAVGLFMMVVVTGGAMMVSAIAGLFNSVGFWVGAFAILTFLGGYWSAK